MKDKFLMCYLDFLAKAAISHAYPQSDQRSATHLRCMVGHSSGHGYYAALWQYYEERGRCGEIGHRLREYA